jgi:hypothetical protein
MTYRRSLFRNGALPAHGPHDDAGDMADSPPTTAANRCTCTGGPYLHGPEGLRKVLREIETAQPTEHGEDLD